ncbi:MAG: hypothetical protein ACXVLQ_15510 [Bacteriovorax sp.]
MQGASQKNVFYENNIQNNEMKEARVLKFHNIPDPDNGPKKFKTNHYFSVKNHFDLFDIGKHYMQLSQSGKKSFSFYAEDSKSCQQTMLGLSSFFNYHQDIKSIMLVENFEKSELKNLLKPPHREERNFNDEYFYEVLSFDGIEILEYDKLRNAALKMGPEGFSQFIASFITESSLILSEMPKIQFINREKEFFFPLIRTIDSLSVIVEPGKSKNKELKELINFSKKYAVEIDGVLFSPDKEKING